ncbi:MAG: ABC transporter permease [Thermoanaerobaculia bacterium]
MKSDNLPQEIWKRFRRSRLAVAAVIYVLAIAIVAALAPMLANAPPVMLFGSLALHPPVPYAPNAIDLGGRLQPPGNGHHLGTDDLGRDVLARIIHGARVSLAVGFLATALSLLVGSILGALAGYYGGAVDWIVSRLIEVFLCFPFLFLVLAIVALFRPSLYTIMIALGLTSWTTEARYVRGEFLRIREMEFAYAARASGARDSRIIFRHLLPNAIAPVLVSASFGVAFAILTESALSFLGAGVPLPTASWGSILSVAQQFIDFAWWLVLFPGVAIFTTVVAFNIIGDRLRDALDPRAD